LRLSNIEIETEIRMATERTHLTAVPLLRIMLITPDVRFGSLADICVAKRHVCFTTESRHQALQSACSYGPTADIGNH
jgi:hypothetical protein